jgi:hypothetical protein
MNMTFTTDAVNNRIAELREEAHQTLLGAVKASGNDKDGSLQQLSANEWQAAARSVLLHRRTSILSALSDECMTAVALGHIDMAVLTRRTLDVADEHGMQQAIVGIAHQRLRVDLADGYEPTQHSLDTAVVGDALMDAFAAGRESVKR